MAPTRRVARPFSSRIATPWSRNPAVFSRLDADAILTLQPWCLLLEMGDERPAIAHKIVWMNSPRPVDVLAAPQADQLAQARRGVELPGRDAPIVDAFGRRLSHESLARFALAQRQLGAAGFAGVGIAGNQAAPENRTVGNAQPSPIR